MGVSTCLLGEPVRFDGGHKRDRFLTDLLGPHVEWVPVCPEVEAGLGIPRPSIRLEQSAAGELRVIDPKHGIDHTRALARHARTRVRALAKQELCGYVLKKNSPSCGMERVRLADHKGHVTRNGVGLFAAALMEAMPQLPVEEEGRLTDARLRENFVERLFAYRRLRALFAGRWRTRDVVAFHTAHKLQVMAHSPKHYRELGRLVAQVSEFERSELRERYTEGFMAALKVKATSGRHANVLQHMAGYVSDALDPGSRAELAETIERFRIGQLPLVVPITLLAHHVRVREVDYLRDQTYLDPHPRELMLRNHV